MAVTIKPSWDGQMSPRGNKHLTTGRCKKRWSCDSSWRFPWIPPIHTTIARWQHSNCGQGGCHTASGGLEGDGSLNPFPSGFRSGFGTEKALVTLMDDLHWESDRSVSLWTLLDFSVTFSSINHGILPERLVELVLRVTVPQWVCSYLTGLFQKVVLGVAA